ncbi:hypothetical protein CANARDRAFT_29511 [[Candida] arabinofermentans NRRL YB-2248]|uniref:holo-[acyl-carrier-protein] synthase n=1 Tax=[Candida] arabinofermentans NRRL YB-2248 TaxID=983967 RepID=A0A1E4SX85_9ASCO|nr:hypothetical protein CANARDRAFT_29511 [[Candida] arabinofermentans NRRL YB-2248]
MDFAKPLKSMQAIKLNETSKLYFFYIDISDPRIYDYLSDDFNMEISLRMLSLKHQMKIRNNKSQKDRLIKLLTSLFLKYLVSCYEGSELIWDHLSVSVEKYGKPFLKNRGYSYNLSDEDGFVSICIDFTNVDSIDSPDAIGLDLANPKDIEAFNIRNLKDFYKSDFRDIFTDNEIEQIDKIFERDLVGDRVSQLRYLSQYWALKESYSKYKGYGLHRGLQSYEFLNVRQLQPYQKAKKDDTFEPIFEEPFVREEFQNWLVDDVCSSDRSVETMRCMLYSDNDPTKEIIFSIMKTKNGGQHKLPNVVKVSPVYLVEFVKALQS